MNLDWGIIWDSRQVLLQGAAMTVMLTVVTMALAVPGGMVLALMRLSSNRVANGIAVAIVEFFRNLPLILVIYWAFYVMPMALDVQFSAVTTALVALVLNVSAYNSETFRAGINSIRKGQMEAALAMGMSRRQAMFKVLVPQAARRILPVLASTWISLFKDTSLVSVIAVSELAYASMQVRAQSFRVLEMLTAMAVIYWLMGYPQAKLVAWIHRKYAVKERPSRSSHTSPAPPARPPPPPQTLQPQPPPPQPPPPPRAPTRNNRAPAHPPPPSAPAPLAPSHAAQPPPPSHRTAPLHATHSRRPPR
ncbi:amino acid ABC transporter permease, partial [Achromobacter ruhlandii]|uniref:amino acid ABC transporter permease n=1 Tax=Achromobacter ruhlandii TaxID=72557 RepID=UPI00201668D6